MQPQETESGFQQPSGRGLDLFFGDSAPAAAANGPQAGVDATPDLVEATIGNLQAKVAEGKAARAAGLAPDDEEPDVAADMAAIEDIYEPEQPVAVEEAVVMDAAAASIDDLPVVAKEAPPPPPRAEAAGPPLIVETERRQSMASGCLQGLLWVLLGAFLGAVLALSLLYFLNDGLYWAAPRDVTAVDGRATALDQSLNGLSSTVSGVDSRVGELEAGMQVVQEQAATLAALQGQIADAQSQLTSLEERAATLQAGLDGLGGGVDALSGELDGVQVDLDGLSQEVGVVGVELADLGDQVDQMGVSTRRLDAFLQGLRTLLDQVEEGPGELDQSTAPLMPGETLTPTVIITPTVAVTATATITAALPITPTAEPTVATTATAEPTAVVTPEPATATPEPAGTAAPGAIISGVVFVDLERPGQGRNRQQDADEPGIEGVTVTLYSSNLVRLATMITDQNGQYRFDNLPPGQYIIVETDPPDYDSSTSNSVVAILGSDGDQAIADFGDFPDP